MTTAAVKLIENVIILEVENLLQDWPMYVINFTAENTGPQKLILHLKNASKYVRIDSDDEDETVVSEHRISIIGSLDIQSFWSGRTIACSI
ncbi:hypothetical protein EDC04DRAFT_2901084 [Pisolithus marmoratus]|nr:hypothetical protein EDC04DRAFT_2901084 [Pisolithus marmoratus]